MIERMSRYSFVLLNADKEAFLARLQELGVMDITRSAKPVDERSESILHRIEELNALVSCIVKGSDARATELQDKLARAEETLNLVSVWGDYDLEKLSPFGIHYYSVPEKKFDSQWAYSYALQEVLRRDGRVWFVLVGDNGDFPVKELPAPSCTKSQAEAQVAGCKEELDSYIKTLSGRKDEIPSLRKEISRLGCELNRYLAGITGETAAQDTLVVYEAFAPSYEDERLAPEFDAMGCVWMKEAATAQDNPPIKLRNNWFAKQFEVLTGMYGMPVYDEFDPTPILAPFFLLFFALCMGDAGYGILMILIGLLMKGKNGGLAKLWRLIVTLGIGTFFVGLLLGNFFGIGLAGAAWYPEVLKGYIISGTVDLMGNNLDIQMVMAVCIGIFHICLAMAVKAVLYTRRFGFKNNISTWGWTLLICGSVLVLTLGMLGVLAPDIARWTIISIGALSALAIYIFNKPGRNPLLNIGAGLWDTYGIATGILGDVLSYIRLYALGLAGGILGSTFNELGHMILGDNPSWQWIAFLLLVVFGHALNLAMSCLGAFVHPLRLTFVEYFKNSGYEGTGRKYSPLENQQTNN